METNNTGGKSPKIPGEREGFKTIWGFMFAVIGIAIGLGNIWRFPYMVGLYGGGAWIITFIIIVAILTFPALTAEWVLGRNTQSGPMGAFYKVGFPKGKFVGGFFSVAIFLVLYYYLPVSTYIFMYIFASAFGLYSSVPVADFFGAMAGNIPLVFLCQAIVVGLLICNLLYGVRGIEKVSKFMTPLFFVLLLIVLIRGITLPGAVEGTINFLKVDWSKMTGSALLTAMGQAFFSLSLGGTLMVTYSSYLSKKASILKTAAITAYSDLFGAFICFLVVIPASFAFSVDVAGGPRLLFMTLPQIFLFMPFGLFFATITFIALYFVVHMSLMSGIEVITTVTTENFGWTRRKSVIFFSVLILILSIPVLFSEEVLMWSDLILGSIGQPLGALFAMIAVGWFMGKSRALGELQQGDKLKIEGWFGNLWYIWVRYIIPVVIIIVLVYGIITW